MLNYVPKGQRLVLCEDDINAVIKIVQKNGKNKAERVSDIEELDRIVKEGFEIAKKHGTICFGLNMTVNPFFMKEGYTRRRLVHTGFMGLINTDLRFDEKLTVFDDPEMNCQIIKRFGSVISLNGYGADIDRFVKGGCSEAWADRDGVKEAVQRVFKKHGDILDINNHGHMKLSKEAIKDLGL